MSLEHDLRASLAAVQGPPPRVLAAEELPTDEQLNRVAWSLEILITPNQLAGKGAGLLRPDTLCAERWAMRLRSRASNP